MSKTPVLKLIYFHDREERNKKFLLKKIELQVKNEDVQKRWVYRVYERRSHQPKMI